MNQKCLTPVMLVEYCNRFNHCFRALSIIGLSSSERYAHHRSTPVSAGNKLRHFRNRTGNAAEMRHRPLLLSLLILSLLIVGFLLPSTGYAHRGAIDEVDPCRIKVGNEWVHFTAYTPEVTAGKGYCNNIPQVGMTNLVFDYEGKELRHVSVEFEITKEPEGTRVFYQEPKKILTGTVNGVVDFGKFGPGDYLAHVTIIDKGEKIDKHVPFSVGMGDDSEGGMMPFLILVLVLIIVILIMLWKARSKGGPAAPSEQEE